MLASIALVMKGEIITKHATLQTRLFAFIIDSFLIGIPAFGISNILKERVLGTEQIGIVNYLIFMIIMRILLLLYFAIMESSSMQATLGKKIFNIVVTDLYRNRISFGKATIRYIFKFLPGDISLLVISAIVGMPPHFSFYVPIVVFILIFMPAFFTPQKQAFHDIVAKTIVMETSHVSMTISPNNGGK
jgi:uncharacterized RDD family membrane protein YckC